MATVNPIVMSHDRNLTNFLDSKYVLNLYFKQSFACLFEKWPHRLEYVKFYSIQKIDNVL